MARGEPTDSNNKRPRSPEKHDRGHDGSKRRRKDDDGPREERRRRDEDHRNGGETRSRSERELDDSGDDRTQREQDRRGAEDRHNRDRRETERQHEDRRDRGRKERDRDRDRDRERGKDRDRDRDRDLRNGDHRRSPVAHGKSQSANSPNVLSSRHKQPAAAAAAAVDLDMVVDEDGSDDQIAALMQRVMGFSAFKSTKNTKVPGNDKNFGVRKEKKTEYRQYMNRVGGFNRPLSPGR